MLATFNFYLPDEDHQIICEKNSAQFQRLLALGYCYEWQLPDRIGGDPGGVNWLNTPEEFAHLQALLADEEERLSKQR